MLCFKFIAIDSEASLFGRGNLDLEDVFQCLQVLLDLPCVFVNIRESKLLIRYKFGYRMVHDCPEEVIIEVTYYNKCQEIHQNVHDGVVGVKDYKIDDLDVNDQNHLKETIKPCN